MKCFPFGVILALIMLCSFVPVRAAGIPVIDTTNLAQTTVSAFEAVEQTLKQVEQYAAQLQQLEDQIKNSLAPAAYVWSKAQSVMGKVTELQSKYNQYVNMTGNMDQYLMKFANVNAYRSSPYFSAPAKDEKAREAQRQAILAGEQAGSEAQKLANDSMAMMLQDQQKALTSDAATIERLQSTAQSAQGRLEAIQYTNQFLAQQNAQLLQLRGAMMAQMQAENARAQAVADREARQQAASEAFLKTKYESSSEMTSRAFP